MNTSPSLDAPDLAHRLTVVGHALHHRLFAQLRESGLHPKTVAILRVIDGRLDAPWLSDRIARGGKRTATLAERGWIARVDEAWVLTDEGRAILDRADTDRAALLADLPADELAQLRTSLDTLADALGVDATVPTPRGSGGGRGFGPGFGPGFRPGFGRGLRPGFGDGFGPGFRPGFGPGSGGRGGSDRGTDGHDGFGPGTDGHDGFGRGTDGHDGGAHGSRDGHPGHPGRHGRHGGPHRAHRAAQHAFERGFDAGFCRGRESAASE